MTIDFVIGHTDTLSARTQELIPFDSPGTHQGWLKEKVEKGELNSLLVLLDGEDVGQVTFCVVENPASSIKELLVSTAAIESHKIGFLPMLKTVAVKLGREAGCDYVRFHTVRKGLVKQAIALDFYVSEIVLRHKINP